MVSIKWLPAIQPLTCLWCSAVPVGFVIFVISWITLIVIRLGFPFDSRYSIAAQAAFALMPWALLGKGLQDLAFAAGAQRAPYNGVPL